MRMYTGDLEPNLVVTLSSPDGAVDATTAQNVRIIGKRGDTIVFDREPDVTVNGATSVVTMEWEAGDTDDPGYLQIEVEVTWPGVRPQTFRTDGGVKLERDFDYVEA